MSINETEHYDAHMQAAAKETKMPSTIAVWQKVYLKIPSPRQTARKEKAKEKKRIAGICCHTLARLGSWGVMWKDNPTFSPGQLYLYCVRSVRPCCWNSRLAALGTCCSYA